MRLLFCIKTMQNNGGGAERVLADVANGLATRGHEVIVLSFDKPGGCSFYRLDSKIKRIQLGIGSINEQANIYDTIGRIAALRKSVLAQDPDVVIGFMHSMFIPLGISLVGASIPMIASEHIVPEHYRSRPLEGLLLRITPALAKRITCVSDQVRCSYPPSIKKKMVTVVNPLNIDPRRRADVAGNRNSRKILLTVGRLDPQKDHLTLIDAFAKIADRLPDWDLRIVGDGNLRLEIQSKVDQLGLSDRVFLPGSTKAIASEYLSAQMYVQSSRYESFGLTIAEALTFGLPAVGFDDCKGTNQLIRPGINGELAAGCSDRSSNLANTLIKLMKDDHLRVRLSEKADDGLDKFRLANVLDHWENLLLEVSEDVSEQNFRAHKRTF